jgi:hypothetical protein
VGNQVMLHPMLNLSVSEKIQFLESSFVNCTTLQSVVAAACHHAHNLSWIRSAEEARYATYHCKPTQRSIPRAMVIPGCM